MNNAVSEKPPSITTSFYVFLGTGMCYLRTKSIYCYYYHCHFCLSGKKIGCNKELIEFDVISIIMKDERERDCKLDWDKVEPLGKKKNRGLLMYLHTYTKELKYVYCNIVYSSKRLGKA